MTDAATNSAAHGCCLCIRSSPASNRNPKRCYSQPWFLRSRYASNVRPGFGKSRTKRLLAASGFRTAPSGTITADKGRLRPTPTAGPHRWVAFECPIPVDHFFEWCDAELGLSAQHHRHHNRDTADGLAVFDDPLLGQGAVDRFKNNAYDLIVDGQSTAPGSSPASTKTGLRLRRQSPSASRYSGHRKRARA